jgi:hypothetical protein
MGLGIHIKLGTAQDDALESATFVEIYERMGEPTTYAIRYEIDIIEQDLPDLIDVKRDVGSELAMTTVIDEVESVLVQGPVRGHKIHLEHGGGDAWMEISGADKSIEMDREVKARVFASGSASDAVTTILAEYGFEADVEDTNDNYDDNTHALVQRDTDLRFIRRLARRYGFLFWITTDATTGTNTAHFKRPPVDEPPVTTVQINIDPPTIESLDIQFDIERATAATALALKLEDKTDLDGGVLTSPITALGTTPLSSIGAPNRTLMIAPPVDDVADLVQRAEGALIEEGWFVKASFTVDFATLKSVVRAHTMLQLDGAGSRHSGKYFVAAVHHQINTSGHKMDVELVRNAWGAQ